MLAIGFNCESRDVGASHCHLPLCYTEAKHNQPTNLAFSSQCPRGTRLEKHDLVPPKDIPTGQTRPHEGQADTQPQYHLTSLTDSCAMTLLTPGLALAETITALDIQPGMVLRQLGSQGSCRPRRNADLITPSLPASHHQGTDQTSPQG